MKISDIRRYDSEKMYEAYEKWPEISQENYFSRDLQKIQFKLLLSDRTPPSKPPKKNYRLISKIVA